MSVRTPLYDEVAAGLVPDGAADADEDARLARIVDALWPALAPTGVSWLGFYRAEPGVTDGAGGPGLVLGPHRDTPACSPIGLHGVCGQALRRRCTRIVDDVRELGDAYVACDPRDRSEIVVPIVEPDGTCRLVLDLDSRAPRGFDERDDAGLRAVLRAAGFRAPEVPPVR